MNGSKWFLLIIIGAALILGTASLALAQESSAAADEVEAANLAVTEKWVAFMQNRPELITDRTRYREAHREVFKLSYLWHDAWSDSATASSPGTDFEWDIALVGLFSDLQFTVKSIVAGGDLVFVHYSTRGTFANPFTPPSSYMVPLKPTGKVVEEEGVYVNRFENGKIVEQWWYIDSPIFWAEKALLLENGSADAESQQIYNLNNPK